MTDPRPDIVGEIVRFSIARPKASLVALGGDAAARSPIIMRLKKTSGEVHTATARPMRFVRNDRPTSYAATKRGHVVRIGKE